MDRLEATAAGHGAPRSARNRTFRKPRLDSAAMDGREWIGSKPPLPVMAWRAAKRAEQDVPQAAFGQRGHGWPRVDRLEA
ncbi:hypothetical protein, partial [Dokdonella sp.]|uniref:hypothetical protein n=1 Tax=Dokdonella sp. TaxID=2291710 RepID=UPI0027B93A79